MTLAQNVVQAVQLLLSLLINTSTHIRHDVLGGVDEGGLALVQHVVQDVSLLV